MKRTKRTYSPPRAVGRFVEFELAKTTPPRAYRTRWIVATDIDRILPVASTRCPVAQIRVRNETETRGAWWDTVNGTCLEIARACAEAAEAS